MSAKRVAVVLWITLCGAGMAMGQTEWVQWPGNPIIGPGEPGSWDEGGHWLSNVIFDGSTYHMWFSGTDQTTGPTDIGHATSLDGVVWTMDPGNPCLTRGAPGAWDSGALLGAAVVYDGAVFHMWYSGGYPGIERAGYATSMDGCDWIKDPGNPVIDVGDPGSWDDHVVRPNTVIADSGTFRMWYGGANTARVVRIGYAESSNGIDWTKHPDPVLEPSQGWEGGTLAPYVIADGLTYHMWYVGTTPGHLWGGHIGYAYSGDGIHWHVFDGNPVLVLQGDNPVYASPVIFDGSTYHLWYSHWDTVIDWISHATSTCCSTVHASFIPAAAFAAGAQGSFFQTDLDLSNADTVAAEYELWWLPRGEENSDPAVSEVFSLGAGMSVRYANVLAEVLGLEPGALGALAITSSSPHLLAMSRTYNLPGDGSSGTYGQSIPAIAPEEFIGIGERRRILFGTENAAMRTNVGCQNAIDGIVPVDLELFDMEGNALATETLVLRPWGNDQVNRIFEDFAPITGYVEVSTPLQGGLFYCYGSVLDNITSDPTTIPPM